MKIKSTPEVSLVSLDNDFKEVVNIFGNCGIRHNIKKEPYEELIRAVAYQQINTRVADIIIDRMIYRFSSDGNFPTPEELLIIPIDSYKNCGFSFSKAETIILIAKSTVEGIVPPLKIAQKLSDEEIFLRLISLKGVGRWTVEMLLIYGLDRKDILPASDLGIRKGYMLMKGLTEIPSPAEMKSIGEKWLPYRTIAS
ncbi:DNA-3-methyladenine glycosylase family protein [Rosenbergiella australiborealis]|uniref:DNA-3-methyladenine glycosylase family protein n=1 Tax=Rosenbergiella australiborealis TaxID=1544696 RepID=UPI001F4D5C31|nr:DNA-3-methyladenine glycosylase 2 family protein [Rosenbergiella australiborealis]